MSKTEIISTGYTPRYHQDIIHRNLLRFNVLVCHRRFGKTVLCTNETNDRGLRLDKKNPQYAYVAPTYMQAKRIAWDMFLQVTEHIPGRKVNVAELRIEIPRPWLGDTVRYVLLGSENPNTIRGMYLDGIILDEYGECDPTLWPTVRPALSDRLGWAIFIGTPKGRNHFYDIKEFAAYNENWYLGIFKASETGVIPKEELDAAREEMSPEEFAQEFECSFESAMVGSYYGKYFEDIERERRITAVPHDPYLPTEVAWDLGMGDSTAI